MNEKNILDCLKAAKKQTMQTGIIAPLCDSLCFNEAGRYSSDDACLSPDIDIIRKYRSKNIAAYADKPTFAIKQKDTQYLDHCDTIMSYLGVELELEMKNGAEYYRSNIVGATFSLLSKKDSEFCICKRDGSLKNGGDAGFEICTRPSTIHTHSQIFKEFFSNLPLGLGISSRCGMHVHVSREGLSYLQVSKILLFIHHPNNRKLISLIAGRNSNQYCDFQVKQEKAAFVLPKYSDHHVHKSALNIGSKNTIEFRIFASTLNYNTFMKNLEFCHAMLRFFAIGNNSIDSLRKSGLGAQFASFVVNSRRIYPFLFAYLLHKKFIVSKNNIHKLTHFIPA